MIIYEENVIYLGEEKLAIIKTAVWYKGPTGLVPNLTLALSLHAALQIDTPFSFVFKPVPVAISESGIFEEMS